MTNINSRIKEVRLHLGLTQKALAESLSVKWYQIKDIETGKTKVSAEIAAQLCEKFAINAEWLLTGNGNLSKNGSMNLQKQDPNLPNDQGINLSNHFEDPEMGIQNVESLIWIEKESERLYKELSQYIQTVHNTAKTLKEERKKTS